MIVMIQALHKVSKTNFSKALGGSFKKVTRLLVPLYTRTRAEEGGGLIIHHGLIIRRLWYMYL